ncbi:MAG TPA: helix-turn-helix transcriptional regulator [Solirubrobacterales bacterium]|jgi:DNA-binding PadR family transcriptional regulator
MSLRHAILALLTAKPMSGYEVSKYLDDPVGFVWSAPQSQIYPELRRMEEEALVESETVARGARGTKRRYTVTGGGEDELQEWLATPAAPPPERDPVRLRAVYMDMAPLAAARAQFESHLEHYQRRLELWQQRAEEIRTRRYPLLVARLAHTAVEDQEALVEFKTLAFEGQIARAEAEIAWARSGLKLVERLERRQKRRARSGAAGARGAD